MQQPTLRPCVSTAISLLVRRTKVASSQRFAIGLLIGLSCQLGLTACGLSSQQRVLHEAPGIQVGLVTDMSTSELASSPVRNRHPANLTPQDMRSLIGSLEVSGGSGATLGLLASPPPRPVFTEVELSALAEPLARAFHEASPRERVFFTLRNPTAPYETDRTAGSLFFRDDYLHVVLTDHYAFLQADPGGGEIRDPRDTKGMTLSVVAPAQAATVSSEKRPSWNAFEKVHLSFKPAEILAGQKVPLAATGSPRPSVLPPSAGRPELKAETSGTSTTETVNDLRLQIRELTSANLDLRGQLKEQSGTIEKLQAEFDRLRNEIKPGNSKPSSERKSPRKQTLP